MKVVLSNRVWGTSELDAQEIRDACSHRIELSSYEAFMASQRGGLPYRMERTYTTPAPNVFSIPIGRIDLLPKDTEIVDKRVSLPIMSFPAFTATLRESQANCVAFAERHNSCIIRARPGWGKTFTALAIAARLKQRCLVVVHTKKLLEQWVEEVEKVLGIRCGTIGDSKYQIGDYITVGIIRSVHKHRLSLAKSFGLVIVDEVHHLPAEQSKEFINSNFAKHKIGMSGTLERVDKTHVLIYDYISTSVFYAPDENVMTPKVHVIHVPINFDSIGGANYANSVSILNSMPEYQHLIAQVVNRYVELGHKVLCLCERTTIIDIVAAETNGFPYHYNTPKEQKEACFTKMRSGEGTNIIGSQKIFSEGISENYLSCLVLGFSTKGPPLQQLIGRVIREFNGKKQPVIVDIVLEGRTYKRHFEDRKAQYLEYGYDITEYRF